ncbi:MAG: hypothetical protein EHM64_16800 [Ignavibacteriae bacterium]|nr:MAG: hypothetical protein EHM64_16800 [Ignavibacteriota bacterium]
MYVSQESQEQTYKRLMRVLADSQFVVYNTPYAFVESEVSKFPTELLTTALAFVRDEDVWSAFIPSENPAHEQFIVFGFHFVQGMDNSGFVGWLATHLKSKIGTGVMVICGQNSSRGGIFDYWGAPLSVANEVVKEINHLREQVTGASTS